MLVMTFGSAHRSPRFYTMMMEEKNLSEQDKDKCCIQLKGERTDARSYQRYLDLSKLESEYVTLNNVR